MDVFTAKPYYFFRGIQNANILYSEFLTIDIVIETT